MRWIVCVVITGAACGPTGRAPLQNEIGDVCRSAAGTCVDAQTIRVCVEERWAERPCDDVCAEQPGALVSLGCMIEDDDVDGSESCACEPAGGPECVPGELTCVDADTLSICTEHAIADIHSCAAICADNPLPLRAEGCEAEPAAETAWCNCTIDGVPCDADDTVACADDDTLATCVDGEWTLHDCADECTTGAAARCSPAGDPPQCVC